MLLSGFRIGLSTVNDFCKICEKLIPSSVYQLLLFTYTPVGSRTYPPSSWVHLQTPQSQKPPTTSLHPTSSPQSVHSYSYSHLRILLPRMVQLPCFPPVKCVSRGSRVMLLLMMMMLLLLHLRRRMLVVLLEIDHMVVTRMVVVGIGGTLCWGCMYGMPTRRA